MNQSTNLRDLIKAINEVKTAIDEVDFQYSYVESDQEEMYEKLQDIEDALSENYSAEKKLEKIQKIIDR